jgi:aminopeptidase YwaD
MNLQAAASSGARPAFGVAGRLALALLAAAALTLGSPPSASLGASYAVAGGRAAPAAPPGAEAARPGHVRASQGTEPVLLRVRVEGEDTWDALRSIGAEVYLRGDGFAVVKLPRESLRALRSREVSFHALPAPGADPIFYLVPGRDSPSLSGLKLRVLDREADGSIVAGEAGAIAAAADLGYLTVALDRPWPVLGAGFTGVTFVHDSVTRDDDYYRLTRLISRDSLASYVQHLQDYGTRHMESAQVARAGKWLVDTLGRFGYPDTLFEGYEGRDGGLVAGVAGNVTGSKPGLRHPEFRILVGGHYDSITHGESVPPWIEAPGADDNASGVAAALEIARVLASYPLDATVEYVMFAAEEVGLRGSKHYAAKLSAEGVPADKLFLVNLDMIGNCDGPPWRVKIISNQATQPLADVVGNVAEAYTELSPVMVGNTSNSDHASFHQAGYPAIMLHEFDFSTVYHSRMDRLSEIELDYMTQIVRTVAASVLHLAVLADPPPGVIAASSDSGGLNVEWLHSPDADVIGYSVELLDADGRVTHAIFTRENSLRITEEALDGAQALQVRAEDVLGEGDPSEAVYFGGGSLAAEAVPNPASAGVRFHVFTPGAGAPVNATVSVVDAAGRLVRSMDYGSIDRGSQVLEWDGRASNGDPAPTGVYFYVFEARGVGRRGGKLMVVR